MDVFFTIWLTGTRCKPPWLRVVIGGMTISTLITLILVPVVYMTVAEWQTARAEKKRARQAAAAEAAAGG